MRGIAIEPRTWTGLRGHLSRLVPLLIAIGISVGTLLLRPVTYLENSDDVAIVYFVTQGAACPFISPACSEFLCRSYEAAPDVPWYGILLYGTLFCTLCLAMMLLRSAAAYSSWAGGSIAMVWFVLISAAMGSPTYTVTSILAAGVAMAGLFDVLSRQVADQRVSKLRLVAYGTLLALGYLIRPFGVGAALAAVLPLPLALLARTRRRAAISFTAIFVLPLLGCVLLDVAALQQRSTAERAWFEYNWVRGWVQTPHAIGELPGVANAIESAGWELADVQAFHEFVFFYDEQRFTQEKIEALAALSSRQSRDLRLNTAMTYDDSVDAGASFFCYLAAIMATSGSMIARGRWPWLPLISLSSLSIVALSLQDAVHFPPRIAAPMFLVATLGVLRTGRLLELPVTSPTPTFARRTVYLACRASALAVLAIGMVGHRWVAGKPVEVSHQPKIADALDDADGSALLVMPTCTQYAIDPHVFARRPIEVRSVWTGWATYSPLFYERVAEFEVESGRALLPAMIDRDNRFLLARQSHLRLIAEICRRIHGISVEFDVVVRLDGSLALYRIRRRPKPTSSDNPSRRLSRAAAATPK